MIKYFISYEDLIENNKLNKNITFDSKELNIIRKNKDNKIRIEQLNKFDEFKTSFHKLIQDNNYKNKRVLLVELSEEEKNLFNPLLIKNYKLKEDGSYEKIYQKNNIIKLIPFNELINMRNEEIKQGEILTLMPCVSKPKYKYISLDKELTNINIFKRRDILNNMDIGCDLYFYTTNEEILERYKDSVIKIKEIDFHTYELLEHKLFVLDSLSQDRMSDFTYHAFNLIDNLYTNAIRVNVNVHNDKYLLNINNINLEDKTDYIITNNLNTLFYDKSIIPILKYINVYELENGYYKKIPLIDYLDKKDILKYIKKLK